MPLIANIDHGVLGQTYLWSIKEDEHYFIDELSSSGLDLSVVDGWHPKRQREWLSGRHLINTYLDHPIIQMDISSTGKPYFRESESHFSISHSGNTVAISISRHHVGIDIQINNPKMDRIAHKFMTQREYDLLDDSWAQSKKQHFIWCAKEAMFKAYGLGEVDFKEHLSVMPIVEKDNDLRFIGSLQNDQANKTYMLQYRHLHKLHMVVAWERIEVIES